MASQITPRGCKPSTPAACKNTTINYIFQTGTTTFGNQSTLGGLRCDATFVATPANVTVGNVTGSSFTLVGNIAVSALPYGNVTNIPPRRGHQPHRHPAH